LAKDEYALDPEQVGRRNGSVYQRPQACSPGIKVVTAVTAQKDFFSNRFRWRRI
jgi:hypothetical protein